MSVYFKGQGWLVSGQVAGEHECPPMLFVPDGEPAEGDQLGASSFQAARVFAEMLTRAHAEDPGQNPGLVGFVITRSATVVLACDCCHERIEAPPPAVQA